MSDEENQEWIVVRPKKRKMIQKQIRPERIITKGKTPLDSSLQTVLQQSFLQSQTFENNLMILRSLVKNLRGEIMVHCLGLGHFSTELKPYLQLMFFKKVVLTVLTENNIKAQINVYDPIFNEKEKTLIRDAGWHCEQFKQQTCSKDCIFYMPHCQRFLYEAACSSKTHRKSLIIGNSIRQYKNRCLLLSEEIPLAFKDIEPIERNLFDFKDAFNDTFAYLI